METSASMSEQRVQPVVVSNKKVWAGRILSGLSVAFLLFDSIGKLMMVPQVLEGSEQLGYPVSSVRGIGLVLLASVVTYMIPRTSVLGAILLTGFLGGAVATHVRVDNPLFSHVLFPLYVAAMIWGGLLLRDERLRALLPLRK
ncbi:DoxX family protein [Sorangium sp. So ce117]|uniref:DoxX family protein n=1 Tax=Sorangium sp. So ce117 TaxID=3133277 RepID=UPI003F5F1C47